ncbi:MAG: Asp-tRNA(Asn)/Glu-tRNA(Gln) amidotransferase subunit GatB [Anaerolineaceae bacterium]|nr:Asp-tRNA(Asn)/Glu-tRNA(Gln) amidotransferase subunit GatB [Anaerolineaceae bacterium]
MTEYEVIIGLETHIQLNTQSKIFCSCKADSWNDEPNQNICPVCTGMPGVLPVVNKAVIEKAVLLATAMHATVPDVSYFDRKNYFYPDLPKGYQISQYDMSIGLGGYMDLQMADYTRQVRIHKLHIEEDAGKTKNEGNQRLIDFNRCGVPLIEMVTEPDLRSAEEAAEYLTRLRQLVRWIGVSEADMEKGHLRADANVSIRPKGADYLNPKTELKNLNSIEAMRTAVGKEVERQIAVVEAGERVKQWTLRWDENRSQLQMMRSKETEADYRYFREPDLLAVRINEDWKQKILSTMTELPLETRQRFVDSYGLPLYDAEVLTSEHALADYFDAAVRAYGGDAKKMANWLMNDVMRLMNDQQVSPAGLKLRPVHLAELQKLVDAKTINHSTAKKVLVKVEESGKSPAEVVQAEGLAQVSDDAEIREICAQVIESSPDEAASFRDGKESLIGWFVGQVMRQSRGKANPNLARSILLELLNQ